MGVALRFGGVEAGGSKFRCAIGTGPEDIREDICIETTTPKETLDQVVEFFLRNTPGDPIAAVGIGSFGPLDLREDSDSYGNITSTPKEGWSNTNIVGVLRNTLNVPIGFDTDVAAAALAEYRWGAARGIEDLVYLTVGTGIGGAALVRGNIVHGLVHPEMGHMLVPCLDEDTFAGVCPFHGVCLEGMASGIAIEERWGVIGEKLPNDHPAWEFEAHYLAYLVANVILMFSPKRIVIGGGVLKQEQLFPLIRSNVKDLLNGYVAAPEIEEQRSDFIVAPALGDRAGVLGAIALANDALSKS